jgi:hypothetical protein
MRKAGRANGKDLLQVDPESKLKRAEEQFDGLPSFNKDYCDLTEKPAKFCGSFS